MDGWGRKQTYRLGTAIAANLIYGEAVPKIPSRGAALWRRGGVFWGSGEWSELSPEKQGRTVFHHF